MTPAVLAYRRFLDGRPSEINGGACVEVTGYSAQEIGPSDTCLLAPLVIPEDREAVAARYREGMLARGPFALCYRIRRRDGAQRHLLETAIPVPASGEDEARVEGMVVDVSDCRRAEDALRASEEFVRSVLDTVDEGFIVVDRGHRILTANRAYCAQVGRPEREVIGARCHELSHGLGRPCHEEGEECPVRDVFETGAPHAALHRHSDAGGGLLYVETKAFPIRDASGNVVSVIETVNNITERHLLEEERLKSQKLEAIGTLAGGIAHDFNNLLQGVFGYIALAKMSLAERERALAMLEQAEQALNLSVNLTTQLLTFSKGGTPAKTPIALRPVIENAARFALSGSRTTWRLDCGEGVRAVDADAGQIGQVIQNIVLNADHAMPGGGTVSIAVRDVRAPDRRLPGGLAAGEYVAIAIADRGVGIPPEHLRRIFDPYFSTKEGGSGLGLATSFSIVRNHGGLIDVASEAGRGTTFTVYLPAAAAPPAVPEPSPALQARPRKGSILVMDDEAVVRDIAAELIRALGHEVDFAENGETALASFRAARERGSPFDLVILDLTVRGGMGGAETLERLRAIDAGLKAVVSSGYADSGVVADYRAHGFQACLRKPYTLRELRETLAAVLSS